MFQKRRIAFAVLVILSSGIFAFIFGGAWPDPPQSPLPWRPEAILILGGGDAARVRQGKLLAERYFDVPVIISGDGDVIAKALLEGGLPASRLVHEEDAESTMDNALLTAPLLESLNAKRVALVTNWFHGPRALAAFRKVQPNREFAISFETKVEPVTKWENGLHRREKFASIWYLFRFGIWSW